MRWRYKVKAIRGWGQLYSFISAKIKEVPNKSFGLYIFGQEMATIFCKKSLFWPTQPLFAEIRWKDISRTEIIRVKAFSSNALLVDYSYRHVLKLFATE